jgi:hypothetical protein
MTMQRYFIWRADSEQGPFTGGELWALRQVGSLPDVLPVREEDSDRWLQVSDIKHRLQPPVNADVLPIPARPISQQAQPPTMASPPHRRAAHQPIKRSKDLSPMTVLVVFTVFAAGLLWFNQYVMTHTGPGDSGRSGESFDAYYTAQGFVKEQFPGADSFSEFNQSVVRQSGNTYQVAMTVDGRNAFGGPVRKSFVVEMELSGGVWRHKGTHQQ